MKKLLLILLPILILGACEQAAKHYGLYAKSDLETRVNQSRSFDTNDQAKVMDAVIATLMDLRFTIDEADKQSGVISATSSDQPTPFLDQIDKRRVRANVSVKAGDGKTVVRMNAVAVGGIFYKMVPVYNSKGQIARYDKKKIIADDQPIPGTIAYQNFFESLSKSLFLQANIEK